MFIEKKETEKKERKRERETEREEMDACRAFAIA